ncbi:MAG: TOMM precursor leader peptide-binding protein [Holophaga sp.]|nr:TOMM precursor leader peptide-binding protein [Holophaga sp.]
MAPWIPKPLAQGLKLGFHAHLLPVICPGEGVALMVEEGPVLLHDPVYQDLAPLLDGSRTAQEIAAALRGRADPLRVYYALELLHRAGRIGAGAGNLPPAVAAYWQGQGLDPQSTVAGIQSKVIRVRQAGGVDTGPLCRALEASGLVLGEPEQPALEVVVTDAYLRPEILDWGLAARAAGRPWLLLRPSGAMHWLGPLFLPDGTACPACLRHRLVANFYLEDFLRTHTGAELPGPRTAHPASVGMACHWLAMEISRLFAGLPSDLAEAVLTLDSRTGRLERHQLVQFPGCPVCGTRATEPPAPITLVSRPVRFADDGGFRTFAPAETIAKYSHLVSPITGLVEGLEPMAGCEGTLQAFAGGRNWAFPADSLGDFKATLRQSSAGKGRSALQAQASALGESLERYSSKLTGTEFQVMASLAELGGQAIHPNAVMGYSDRQFQMRTASPGPTSRFNRTPAPFNPDGRIPWSPVWSLTEGRPKLLPTAFLYFPTAGRRPGDPPAYCFSCSNGNASGNNLEEAVLQGFLELVERDATSIWWYNRLSRPGVDLASFPEAGLGEWLDRYAALGRDAWALDLTHDLGIPAFVALSRSRTGLERILFGFGCSLDPGLALQRAFAEMNQFLLGSGTTDELQIADEETLDWLTTATLANQPYLQPDARVPARTPKDFRNLGSGDLLSDIQFCKERVEAKGMEMLVLDLTRADAGMPVAKVIVPGLRHFWARFAPGRLYDVPVALGWLDQPNREEDLNPTPMFL